MCTNKNTEKKFKEDYVLHEMEGHDTKFKRQTKLKGQMQSILFEQGVQRKEAFPGADQKSWSPHSDAMDHMPGKSRKGGALTTSLMGANIKAVTSALSGRGVNTKYRPVLGRLC